LLEQVKSYDQNTTDCSRKQQLREEINQPQTFIY